MLSALGIAYDQTDDHASARTAYEQALKVKPRDPSILNNYAVSRMLAGDYAGAQRLLAQAQADGASNAKIAGNLEKLATLAPPPPAPKPTSAAPQSPMPRLQSPAVVAAAPRSNGAAVAVIEVQHLPPAATAKDNHIASSIHVANTGPKALGAPVVMQRVPQDPLAGPVHAPVTKTASAKSPKGVHVAGKAPAQPATPSLRTAADTN
jgi:hypothetical protein